MRGTLMRNMSMRRTLKPVELLLVPMIDIFTVLVTFLLMTAVFSRLTILQLDLPSSASGPSSEPRFRLEVIIRQNELELTDGKARIGEIPNVNGEYDLKTLSEQALALKREHPDVNDASVLSEPRIRYDDVIQVMDAIRSVAVFPGSDGKVADGRAPQADPRQIGAEKPVRVDLFTHIAVGDAP
jgi:biopolymer transport protein ExbD